ncbi:hypothetical protein PRZ48_001959 [Zasmidium cellare]|uniref:GH64 domain-containing protein n=1 Tax=Zasmidium cellare TaxID=395010 RepID=A0ABR0F4I2_ZASCE|nr:hypothetical protein PRZ48_001959 [Zasmidium cellare]
MSKNLATQASKDGQPWDKLTVKNNKGQLVRVLSPNTYRGFDNKNGNAFNGYWEPYVNQVYSKYSNGNNLLLYTSAGTSSCSVTNNQLNCYGDNQGYPKPSSADIFSCNTGPFGNITQYNNQHQQNVPILCSAFVRSMLLVSGSQPAGPVSQYYQNTPTNWYSYYAHNASFSGVGYAFQFEEPTPAGAQEQWGTIHAQNAALVDFIVGGFGWGGYAPGQYA